jgi:uncharacterized protein (TIGR02118 family)
VTDFVYEICCTGERAAHGAVRAWFEDTAAPAWLMLPGLTGLDSYTVTEDRTHDPFVDDGPGPLLIAMLQFPTAEALSRGIAGLTGTLGGCPPDIVVSGTMLERRFYPVAGERAPGPLRAPFSYVVRYHRPAEDEARFVANYLETHPALLAQLPRIRSLLCYVPLPHRERGPLPAADYMIGNEVAFDSVEDFNRAMASPVRQEARKHFHQFPPFTGRNTHYPMLRRSLA